MFSFFDLAACGILAPQPETEPTPPALEDKVLTTVLPGKSPLFLKFVELYLWYTEIRFFPFVLVDGAGERSIS